MRLQSGKSNLTIIYCQFLPDLAHIYHYPNEDMWVRIYKAYGSGFIIQEYLVDEVMRNIEESEWSIGTICKYIKEKLN